MRKATCSKLRDPVTAAGVLAAVSPGTSGPQGEELESRFAEVNGLRMHYLAAGKRGSSVILLHGYAHNSHMWRPLMAGLGITHRVRVCRHDEGRKWI